jgi:nitroreductase
MDGSHLTYRRGASASLSDLSACFVPDPNIVAAVESGAAVIVICVDPVRMTMKYGNRGWRYCLMEVGALMHQMCLGATEIGVLCRPVGGYYDSALTELLVEDVLPLLTLVIASD